MFPSLRSINQDASAAPNDSPEVQSESGPKNTDSTIIVSASVAPPSHACRYRAGEYASANGNRRDSKFWRVYLFRSYEVRVPSKRERLARPPH